MENSNKDNFVVNIDVKLNDESLDAITNEIYERLEEKLKTANVESLSKAIIEQMPKAMMKHLNK